jgi:hypothetical protein
VLDVDGDPRALSSTPGCTLTAGQRDIGADEFVPATGIGCPLPPTITPTPAVAVNPECQVLRNKLKRAKSKRKKRKIRRRLRQLGC